MKKLLIAMSGGVDSSVAALLMQREGHTVAGGMMRLFDGDEAEGDALAVARRLGIPFYLFHLAAVFRQEVISRFADEYAAGRTPNPCVDCNHRLKFGALLACAMQLGMDGIATGHYAQTGYDEPSGRYLLRRAADREKDQSYVLSGLTQEQLRCAVFPLGGLNKAQVRALASENGFSNAKKKESQDICFVPDGDYAAYIEGFLHRSFPAGDFVDEAGRPLGKHKGIVRYTIGQRRGLGLALPSPLYVRGKDPQTNTVLLAPEDHLYTREVTAANINLIAAKQLNAPLRVTAKVRYSQRDEPAVAEQTQADGLQITFDRPQRAVTPGQRVVLYDGDVVVGGGTIV